MAYRYIGKGITDSNGIAHLTEDAEGQTVTGYTGTGRGLTDIIASTDDSTKISEGSLQSEIYEVTDSITYDDGVRNIYSLASGLSKTTVSNGTKIESSSSSPLSATIKNMSDGTGVFTAPVCLEFELMDCDENNYLTLTTTRSDYYSLTNTGKYKVTYDGQVISVQRDNDTPTTYARTNSSITFLFRLNDSGYVTVKDVRAYPI